MASQDSSGSESQKLEALAKQLADLERQATEVSAAMQRSGSVRMLLTLVVVALLAVYMYLFYTTGKSFTDKKNLDKLMIELQLSASNNSNVVMHHAQTLVEKTWPKVSAAMTEQIKNDMPKFMTLLGTERETLAVNLQSQLESKVLGHYEKALKNHRDILAENFPSIKDDRDLDLMTDNFRDAFQPLVKQYYGEKLKGEFDKMYKTWDEFPFDDSKRNRDELSQELYHLLFALMQHKLAAGGLEESSPKATGKPSGS